MTSLFPPFPYNRGRKKKKDRKRRYRRYKGKKKEKKVGYFVSAPSRSTKFQ